MLQIHPDYQHLRDYIQQLPQTFNSQGKTLFHKRNHVKRMQAPDGTILIVKRYKRPNLLQRIAYTCVRPTKARRAYEYALRFRQLGVDTPQPVAYIEQKQGPLFADGYYISLENQHHTCAVLRDRTYHAYAQLMPAFTQFILQLHQKGILHGDTNLSNFFYQETDPELHTYHFSAIDLNRTKFVQNPTRKQCLDNLVRITHNDLVLLDIVASYAQQRQWNEGDATEYVMKRLRKFEKRKKLLHQLTHHQEPAKKEENQTEHHHHHHHDTTTHAH